MDQAFQGALNIVCFLFMSAFLFSFLSRSLSAIPSVLFCFHTISVAPFVSSIFMYSTVKSSPAFRSEAARGSSLQLLINYRELKQLELQRYTINKHPFHDATHGVCNHKIAKRIRLL